MRNLCDQAGINTLLRFEGKDIKEAAAGKGHMRRTT